MINPKNLQVARAVIETGVICAEAIYELLAEIEEVGAEPEEVSASKLCDFSWWGSPQAKEAPQAKVPDLASVILSNVFAKAASTFFSPADNTNGSEPS